jgi:hypothetical protein
MVRLRSEGRAGLSCTLRSDFFAGGLLFGFGVGFDFGFFAMAIVVPQVSDAKKREAYRRAAKKFPRRGTDSHCVRLTGHSRLATISG